MEEQRGGPCGWSRGSEGDRGRRRQGGDRQVVQGPVGCREDLGFEPEGGGSHGGLWAGEGGPGLVLTGAPWWLLTSANSSNQAVSLDKAQSLLCLSFPVCTEEVITHSYKTQALSPAPSTNCGLHIWGWMRPREVTTSPRPHSTHQWLNPAPPLGLLASQGLVVSRPPPLFSLAPASVLGADASWAGGGPCV
jgi:hypothetical protein